MSTAAAPRELSLRLPITASVVLHVAFVALFLLLRPAAPPPAPPVYRVTMLAAPPGPRAIGVVQPRPATPPPPAPVTPVRPKTVPDAVPAPTRKRAPKVLPKQATPVPVPEKKQPVPKTPAPTAGGGETGGHGADVANVNTGGIDFPYPGYLENIVRQIALRFHPTSRGALRAEVTFLIRRDGTVPENSIRLSARSGVYGFDLEAQGAVEAAAQAHAFGPLPSQFTDDVLPVTFRFDPRFIH